MNYIRAARAIGGLLSIVVLLTMVFLDFWNANTTLTHESIVLLLTIITGLLGIDLISDKLPMSVTVETKTSASESETRDDSN